MLQVATIRQTINEDRKISFHFEEMRSQLKAAMKYASKGDKSLMEHCINKAETDALECGSYNDAFLEHVAKIQQTTSPNIERSFHFEEMRSHLKAAMKYASKGDKSLMEHCINKAETNALDCGFYNDAFLEQVAKIQQAISTNIERSFHFEEMRSQLKAAMKYASKGDKSLMEHCIKMAETSAIECGSCNETFRGKVAEIERKISIDLRDTSR